MVEGGGFLQKQGFLSRIFNDEQVEKGREEHSLKQELCNRLLNQHLLNEGQEIGDFQKVFVYLAGPGLSS